MRNTKNGTKTQCVETAQKLLLEKITKANSDFTTAFDYPHVEKQINELIYAWVGSDLIEIMSKLDRENTIYFIGEFTSFLKSIFNKKEEQNIDYLQLVESFFDRWSFKRCKTVLGDLQNAFINSEIADNLETRSNVNMFLVEAENYLRSIKM